jgi:hypothetical protein
MGFFVDSRNNCARLCAVLLIALLTACSVAMSSNRSAFKGDPSLFQVGAERTLIEATFGPPATSASMAEGRTQATYRLDPKAHTEGARSAAIYGHLVMDVLTLGLWEVVGTPLEIAARDQLTSYVLVYGPDQKVQSVDISK